MLTIHFKNGTFRTLNVGTAFFDGDLPLNEKVDSVVNDLGKYPYRIELLRGTEVVFRKIILANKPEEQVYELSSINDKDVKKAYRRKHKRSKFASTMFYGSNPLKIDYHSKIAA